MFCWARRSIDAASQEEIKNTFRFWNAMGYASLHFVPVFTAMECGHHCAALPLPSGLG